MLHDRAVARAGGTALKLASAFGGANAALVVTLERPAPVTAPGAGAKPNVAISRAVRASAADLEPAVLAARSGYPVDRITRADDLVRYALAAVAALRERVGDLRGAGIVVGLGLATIETNTKFLARIPRPEPRRFPYTTPNAAAGECAVAFGLDGPAFAVGGGPHGGLEAISVAADLVRAGIIERVVVVAADESATASEELAPGTTSGAIALLVGGSGGEGRITEWGVAYEPAPPPSPLPAMHAHAALAPLLAGAPRELVAEVPWGGRARVALTWSDEP
ncbi:MAG: beta-ketoacyl synthase N-terminal-like domain-containing protein [Labilithrix sp.]